EAVPGLGLAEPVTEFPLQFESLLAVRDGFRVVAEHGVKPADRVERPGLSGPVACGTEQVKGLPCVHQRLPVTALTLEQPGVMAVGVSLAGGVTGRVVQVQSIAQLDVRVTETAQLNVRAA